jgi:two-component system response regulator LytT
MVSKDVEKENSFLIVEDELIIAEHISTILTNAGYVKNFIAMSVDEALEVIDKQKPDMVLTDISLGLSRTGIDLGKLLFEKYKIPFIYITSHSSPDILFKAKQTHPNAYLVKPFKKEDIIVAVELALFNAGFDTKTNEEACLLIKDGHVLARIPHAEIIWLQAEGNYTAIYTTHNKKRLVRTLITELLRQLPAKDFLRIHKSYAVNRIFVTELQSGIIVLKDIKLPVGRTYQEILINQLK